MRRIDEDFEGQELELLYVAGKLEEAKQVEALLDGLDVDYSIRVEQYRAGLIFASIRAGAFFYVLPESATRSREALRQSGYLSGLNVS